MVNITVKILRTDVPVWNTFASTFIVGTFDGEENYESLSQMLQNYTTDILDIQSNGLRLDSGASRPGTFWAGGDLKLLSVTYGFRGDFASGFLPLIPFCDCPKESLGDVARPCRPRTMSETKQLSHTYDGTFTCPGCGENFEDNAQLLAERVPAAKIESWHKAHKGISYHQ
jgi:hypothetical protein